MFHAVGNRSLVLGYAEKLKACLLQIDPVWADADLLVAAALPLRQQPVAACVLPIAGQVQPLPDLSRGEEAKIVGLAPQHGQEHDGQQREHHRPRQEQAQGQHRPVGPPQQGAHLTGLSHPGKGQAVGLLEAHALLRQGLDALLIVAPQLLFDPPGLPGEAEAPAQLLKPGREAVLCAGRLRGGGIRQGLRLSAGAAGALGRLGFPPALQQTAALAGDVIAAAQPQLVILQKIFLGHAPLHQAVEQGVNGGLPVPEAVISRFLQLRDQLIAAGPAPAQQPKHRQLPGRRKALFFLFHGSLL